MTLKSGWEKTEKSLRENIVSLQNETMKQQKAMAKNHEQKLQKISAQLEQFKTESLTLTDKVQDLKQVNADLKEEHRVELKNHQKQYKAGMESADTTLTRACTYMYAQARHSHVCGYTKCLKASGHVTVSFVSRSTTDNTA